MCRSSNQIFGTATSSNTWPGLNGGTTALNTWTHIAMCLSGTTTYCFLDGKLKGTLTDTNTSYVGLTLGTLAESTSGNHSSGYYYKGYIAELKITKGCKWTKDFTLPTTPYSTAKDSNPWKKPIQMFINTGSSTTISSGLLGLEYIESTGTQYIDTGIKASKTLKVEADIDVSPASGWVMILGDYTNGSYFSWWRQNTTMHAYYGSNNKTLAELTGKRKYISNNTNNIWSIDTSKITVTPNSSDFSKNGNNLYLFSVNNGGNYNKASMKLYSCKIYDNGTLVRDFIPIKTTTNIYGLWDKVNKVFYPNAGTGAFTGGPAVTLIGWHKIKGVWAKTAANIWSQAL
jgi:hypothetical protein